MKSFISNNKSEKFRYFDKRDISVIKNHLLIIVVTDENNQSIGYAHIDNENNEQYWFDFVELKTNI